MQTEEAASCACLSFHGGRPCECTFPPEQRSRQEIEVLRTLRASLEAIKQVVQGVHDDLKASEANYAEMARTSSSPRRRRPRELM